MNKVILIGRLTREPKISRSQNSEKTKTIARYTLAVNRSQKQDGENNADFINCVAFDRRAEFVEKYLHQGSKIAIVGKIQTGSYTNNEGQKIFTTEIIINECEFAENKKEKEQGAFQNPEDTSSQGGYAQGNGQNPNQQGGYAQGNGQNPNPQGGYNPNGQNPNPQGGYNQNGQNPNPQGGYAQGNRQNPNQPGGYNQGNGQNPNPQSGYNQGNGQNPNQQQVSQNTSMQQVPGFGNPMPGASNGFPLPGNDGVCPNYPGELNGFNS